MDCTCTHAKHASQVAWHAKHASARHCTLKSGGPMGPGGINHSQVSAYSRSPQYRIVLSWDLLPFVSVKDRILCSFTKFITTPELSGPLYISADIYHTQITEYSLQTISE